MKSTTIEARVGGKDGALHSVTRDMGETLDELVDQFGEQAVYSQAKSAITVSLQGFVRSKVGAKTPVTGDELQTAVDDWKPGERSAGVGKVEKLKEKLAGLDEETRNELLASLGMAPAAKPAVAAKPPAGKPQAQAGKRR